MPPISPCKQAVDDFMKRPIAAYVTETCETFKIDFTGNLCGMACIFCLSNIEVGANLPEKRLYLFKDVQPLFYSPLRVNKNNKFF